MANNIGAAIGHCGASFMDAAVDSDDWRGFLGGAPLDAPETMPAGSMRWGGITVREPCFPYRLRDTDVRAATTVPR